MAAEYYEAYSEVIGANIKVFIELNDDCEEYIVSVYKDTEDDMNYVLDYMSAEIPSLEDVLHSVFWHSC